MGESETVCRLRDRACYYEQLNVCQELATKALAEQDMPKHEFWARHYHSFRYLLESWNDEEA